MFLLLTITLLLGITTIIKYRKQGVLNDFTPLDSKNLKAVLALLIVAHHVSYCSPNSIVLSEFSCWGNVVCGCFFFLSGMGLMKSRLLKGENYLNGFLPKHLWRLFSTLFVVAIGYAIVMITIEKRNVFDYYSGLSLDDTFVPNTWFVFALALLYVFFYISYNGLRNIYYSLSLLFLLILIYIAIVVRMRFAGFWYSSVMAFEIGICYAMIESKKKQLILDYFLMKYLMVWLLTISLILLAVYSLHVRHLLYAPFLCVVFPVFLHQTLCVIRMPRISILTSIGNVSYELYVVHGVFIHFLYRYFGRGYLFTIVLICSLITSFFLNRFISKLNRLI